MSTEIYDGPIAANEFFSGKERGRCIQLTDTSGTTSKDPGAGIFIQGRQADVLACAEAIVAFYSKSRSPAPAPTRPTDAEIERAMSSILGDLDDNGRINTNEQRGLRDIVRDMLVNVWCLTASRVEVSGRSPAEVPPNWSEDEEVKKARAELAQAWDNDVQGNIDMAIRPSDLFDKLCNAVWRSAQPHD